MEAKTALTLAHKLMRRDVPFLFAPGYYTMA
jgi:hypothetical protein